MTSSPSTSIVSPCGRFLLARFDVGPAAFGIVTHAATREPVACGDAGDTDAAIFLEFETARIGTNEGIPTYTIPLQSEKNRELAAELAGRLQELVYALSRNAVTAALVCVNDRAVVGIADTLINHLEKCRQLSNLLADRIAGRC